MFEGRFSSNQSNCWVSQYASFVADLMKSVIQYHQHFPRFIPHVLVSLLARRQLTDDLRRRRTVQIFEKAYATGDCGCVGGGRGSKRLLHGKRFRLVPQLFKEYSLRLKINLKICIPGVPNAKEAKQFWSKIWERKEYNRMLERKKELR